MPSSYGMAHWSSDNQVHVNATRHQRLCCGPRDGLDNADVESGDEGPGNSLSNGTRWALLLRFRDHIHSMTASPTKAIITTTYGPAKHTNFDLNK